MRPLDQKRALARPISGLVIGSSMHIGAGPLQTGQHLRCIRTRPNKLRQSKHETLLTRGIPARLLEGKYFSPAQLISTTGTRDSESTPNPGAPANMNRPGRFRLISSSICCDSVTAAGLDQPCLAPKCPCDIESNTVVMKSRCPQQLLRRLPPCYLGVLGQKIATVRRPGINCHKA